MATGLNHLNCDRRVSDQRRSDVGQHQRLIEMPAGAVEAGESFIQAIRREILEETGYAGELTEIGEHFLSKH